MNRDEPESDSEEVGGLFRVVSRKQHQRQETKNTFNAEDCSRFPVNLVRDWSQQDVSFLFLSLLVLLFLFLSLSLTNYFFIFFNLICLSGA